MASGETSAQPSVGSDRAILKSWDPFIEFVGKYQARVQQLTREHDTPGKVTYADMAFGNPQHAPLPKFVAALKRQVELAEPPYGTKSTFEYKTRIPDSVDAVVKALERTRSLTVDPDDVLLTNGALSALSLSLFVLGDPGDEALFLTPAYFFYAPMIEFTGLKPVMVAANADQAFDLDVEAIRNAITPKTRVVFLNSPNNPTGKIYPMKSLEALALVLQEANDQRKAAAIKSGQPFQPIMVVSDEAYNRIVFDNIDFHSIAEVYPYSLMVYTWGKTLLAPSERFGYIVFSPLMPLPLRIVLRDKFFRAQLLGWSYPNGSTGQAYAEVENAGIMIDISAMQARRDRLVSCLEEDGWIVTKPEGSFYMLVKAQGAEDDLLDALFEEGVLALGGSLMNIPGWIRLSLTASDEMMEYALAAFLRLGTKQTS